MKYTICANYPTEKSGARPNVNDMIDVVRLKFGLDVQGPYSNFDTAKICFETDDPKIILQLMMLFKDKGIDSYWYQNSGKHGDVCYFGNTRRWDKPKKEEPNAS